MRRTNTIELYRDRQLNLESSNIGSLKLKNRLVMLAISTYSATEDGYVTRRMIDFYEERAAGGVGLITVQCANVTSKAPGRKHSLEVYDDTYTAGLAELAAAVRTKGARIALQIGHIGPGQVEPMRKAGYQRELDSIAPSAVVYASTGLVPREMTLKDIDYVETSFAEAARRAREAGFDAVEIHACHGRLINLFLSPFYNKRADAYGGGHANRARFACEIVQRIEEKTGKDFPVIIKINGDDPHDGGSRLEDTIEYAKYLEAAGVDAVCVSAAAIGLASCVPAYTDPTGVWMNLSEGVKKAVHVPVIAVGNMDIPFGEDALQEGRCDFVGLGRPLLADPFLPQKAMEVRWPEVRHCIRCNNCSAILTRLGKPGEGIRCTVNPELCREKEMKLQPAPSQKKVIVVGGGLAGLEAAGVLALRGHKVSLYEKSGELGGQWNIALLQKDKRELGATLKDYLVRGANDAGVKVTLNKEISAQFLKESNSDAVVLATGATSLTPDIPGAIQKHVVQGVDVIAGTASVSGNVVVVGGRLRGMEVACLLAEAGHKVSLVTKKKLGEDGIPLDPHTYQALRDRLIELGVNLYTNSPVREITKNCIFITWQGEVISLKAHYVVLAVGAVPVTALREELNRVAPDLKVYNIGDCDRPMDALEAIQQGAEIGRAL